MQPVAGKPDGKPPAVESKGTAGTITANRATFQKSRHVAATMFQWILLTVTDAIVEVMADDFERRFRT